jgi:hypothetical protein
MLNNIDGLYAERDRLKRSRPVRSKGKRSAGVGGDMPEPLNGTTTTPTTHRGSKLWPRFGG